MSHLMKEVQWVKGEREKRRGREKGEREKKEKEKGEREVGLRQEVGHNYIGIATIKSWCVVSLAARRNCVQETTGAREKRERRKERKSVEYRKDTPLGYIAGHLPSRISNERRWRRNFFLHKVKSDASMNSWNGFFLLLPFLLNTSLPLPLFHSLSPSPFISLSLSLSLYFTLSLSLPLFHSLFLLQCNPPRYTSDTISHKHGETTRFRKRKGGGKHKQNEEEEKEPTRWGTKKSTFAIIV